MKKKYKILIIVGIFLVLSLIIGLSYAYYIFSVSQSGTNIVRSDCFEITFSDGNAINISDGIPLTDNEAKELTPYTFTIKNICNSVMEYNVNIETLNTSTIDLDAIAVKLDGKVKKVLGTIDNNDSSSIVNKTIASSSKTIYTGVLKSNQEQTHSLRIWLDEYATLAQSANKSYSSKVVINGKLKTDYAELISGLLFNKVIKQLAGTEPTQEQIDDYNNFLSEYEEWKNSDEYDPNVDDPEYYSNYNPYVELEDINILSLEFTNQKPSSDENTMIVSTSDSNKEIIAWYDNGNIYLYSDAKKIYMNHISGFMFSGLSGLTDLNLSSFDTSKVTNMNKMFSEMTSLTSLDISNFDTSNVTDMSAMFENVNSLTSLDVSDFDTSKVTDMLGMFRWMHNLTSLDVSNFDTSNVTDMHDMFDSLSSVDYLDVSNFDTSNVMDMSFMFSKMSGLTSLDLSSFDTSNVTNMRYMFNKMSGLTSLDLSNFNTSNVTDMYAAFSEMTSLTSLDISNFDTSNVTDMSAMFKNSGLSAINLNNFNTSNVTKMGYMFGDMKNLTSLDLSSFNTFNVTTMHNMFDGTNNIKTIYVGSGWDITKLKNDDSQYDSSTGSRNMFKSCIRLVGGAGTTYDSNHIDKEYARIDDPTNGNPGYFTLKTN